ncbi:MAG: hypothetical protein NWE99_07995 [Candidatus Bathyarchaeota archaeon]|nr:hypothetical protein [Candidatus Bathyarchaeota archaeon]
MSRLKCPDCGAKMHHNPKSRRLECWNPSCSVIEVRLHRKKSKILRRAA